MEQFANPELIKQLPVSERLIDSLIVTVLGMGITFLALILLMYCIRIMSSVLGVGQKKKEQKASSPSPSAQAVPAQKKEEEDDGELLAVLTAAIATATGSSKKLIIRSYRQVGESLSTWSKVGIDEMIKK